MFSLTSSGRISQVLLCLLGTLALACGSSNPGDDDGGNGDKPDSGGLPGDRDGDGLSDEDEETHGTDPDNPDSDGDGLNDGDEVSLGTDPNNPDSDGDGILDGDEAALGTDPNVPDSACAGTSAVGTIAKKPVDIIIAIDSSSSMGGEINAVETNINVNLAQQLEASDVDYRIVLIADHDENDVNGKFGICIGEPLTGNDCTAFDANNIGGGTADGSPDGVEDPPIDGERFKHYPIYVGSHDAYDRILTDFDHSDSGVYNVAPQGGYPETRLADGYSQFLRQDALKVFLVITDDDPLEGTTNNATDFDSRLLALSPAQFGSASDRNYVFHTIIGVAGKSNNTSEPWLPTDAVQPGNCGAGSESPATQYQDSAILTGGLRFPLCNNDNFDAVFQAMAVSVTEGVALECSYSPAKPAAGELDFSRIVAYFTSGAGTLSKFTKVADESACAGDDTYYVDNQLITLCPATCDRVQADEQGALDFHVACTQIVD